MSLLKTGVINRYTYHNQYYKINQNKIKVIRLVNQILAIMGKAPISGKGLTVQNVNDVISQYLIDVIVSDWDTYQNNQNIIDQHIAKHFDKSKIKSGALAQWLRNALLAYDKDSLNADYKEIYDAFNRWLTEYGLNENNETLLK